jgi:hypothetical protein
MALRAAWPEELKERTALEVRGLSSRAKFHKQYRRNGIPAAMTSASKYATIDQFSLRPRYPTDNERKGVKKYWINHEDSMKIPPCP